MYKLIDYVVAHSAFIYVMVLSSAFCLSLFFNIWQIISILFIFRFVQREV